MKVLFYLLGSLTLAFGIVAPAGWAPCGDGPANWVMLGAYSVLAAWMISVAYWLLTRRRKDDSTPWTPSESARGGEKFSSETPR